MSEQLGYMRHSSTSMLITNLVNAYILLPSNDIWVGKWEMKVNCCGGLWLCFHFLLHVLFIPETSKSTGFYTSFHLRCGSWEKGSWRSISSSEAGFGSTQWGKVKSHILQSASNFLIFTFCLPSTFPCIILSMSGQFLSLRVSHCFDLCVPHKILRYLLSCQYPKKKKELGFICALKTILDKFTK